MEFNPSRKLRQLLLLPKTYEDMNEKELSEVIIKGSEDILLNHLHEPESPYVTKRVAELEIMSARLEALRSSQVKAS